MYKYFYHILINGIPIQTTNHFGGYHTVPAVYNPWRALIVAAEIAEDGEYDDGSSAPMVRVMLAN